MEQRYGRDERTRRSYVGGGCIGFSEVCSEVCCGSEDLGFERSAIGDVEVEVEELVSDCVKGRGERRTEASCCKM